MKRQSNSPPYLSWCLVVRNSASKKMRDGHTFEKTLQSLRERTPDAEIVVVDTCSSDETLEVATKYADVFEVYRGPRGDWNEDMHAVDDMRSARERSFEIASGVWRGWVDDDDRIAGPEEAEHLLKLASQFAPKTSSEEVADEERPTRTLEQMLRLLDEEHPSCTGIIAPYLYRRDEHGHATIWQKRWRIVRWGDPPPWRWAEEAHEILVPTGDTYPPRVTFAHLLFVHEKDWDQHAVDYSVERHFKILHGQYQAGDITARRCFYLATFAQQLCPDREYEFIEAAHRHSHTILDRYRALIQMGHYWGNRGMFLDAWEKFDAAVAIMPNVPDAWIASAEHAIQAGDTARAVQTLREGIKHVPDMESLVTPRDVVIRYPTLLADQLEKLAHDLTKQGANPEAVNSVMREADALRIGVLSDDAVGEDHGEAKARAARTRNLLLGYDRIAEIGRVAKYLVDNDEPEKAVDLLDCIPHNMQDHPVAIELERWSRKLVRHITDPAAYRDFYNSEESGYAGSPEAWLHPDGCLGRVHWMSQHIPEGASVLDLGCFDGIIGIPLMRLRPDIKYTGVDIGERAIESFRKRIRDAAPEFLTPVELHVGESPPHYGPWDVIIWSEIIEHVPNPVDEVQMLSNFMHDNSILLITTPWGAYDAGHPPPENIYGKPRDERGHLRAMTARDLYDTIRDAELDVMDMQGAGEVEELGHELRAVAWSRHSNRSPVAFCVAGALWDWNSRTVHAEGIGASEETIVYLGARLAGERDIEVFGPVPHPEVHHGVAYWPREQLRHLHDARDDTCLVVSRAPSYIRTIREQSDRDDLRAVLWLQDTHYPDLNAETAEMYDAIVGVSEWHRELMIAEQGIPPEKTRVLLNFLLPEHFAAYGQIRRHPHHFVYASSPDRGLIKLLELWPRVLDIYPDATLDIFYGWRGCFRLGSGGDASWMKRFYECRRRYEELRWQKGIRERGMVNHQALALSFMQASAWTYPTNFHETNCLTAAKVRAAGAVPVTTALAALNETAACEPATLVDPFAEDYDEQWLEGLRKAVETTDEERNRMHEEAIENHGIDAVLPTWKEVLG